MLSKIEQILAVSTETELASAREVVVREIINLALVTVVLKCDE